MSDKVIVECQPGQVLFLLCDIAHAYTSQVCGKEELLIVKVKVRLLRAYLLLSRSRLGWEVRLILELYIVCDPKTGRVMKCVPCSCKLL